jgi:hypothetical protein
MQMLDIRTNWSRHFLAAMDLAAQASARLPFGVPDPVMGGAAAVALYTGGLWPATARTMTTADAGPLVAALFAVGFRAARGMRIVDLWHPDCPIGIDLVPAAAPDRPTEPANHLTVALDIDPFGPLIGSTLRVVGIEDLIIAQARTWLSAGAPGGEDVTRLQALVALARAGVGGPLRAGYLQRRLAWATQGEVAIEDLPFGADTTGAGTPRAMRLSEMQARIQAWRRREGLLAPPLWAVNPDHAEGGLAGGIGGGGDAWSPPLPAGGLSATVQPLRRPPGLPPAQ